MKGTLRIPDGNKCDSRLVNLKRDHVFYFKWKVHNVIKELFGEMKEETYLKRLSQRTIIQVTDNKFQEMNSKDCLLSVCGIEVWMPYISYCMFIQLVNRIVFAPNYAFMNKYTGFSFFFCQNTRKNEIKKRLHFSYPGNSSFLKLLI